MLVTGSPWPLLCYRVYVLNSVTNQGCPIFSPFSNYFLPSHKHIRPNISDNWRFSSNYWTRVFIVWTYSGSLQHFLSSPSKSHQHKLCNKTLISSFHCGMGDFRFSRENIFSLQKGDLLGRISLPFFKGRFWRENLPSVFSREISKK